MCVSVHVSVSIIFLHCCIVCITSPTSKWTVPARTYLKINAVLDVAKKLISFTGVSLSLAHTSKHTQARSDSISVTTHRQNAMLVADLRCEHRRWLNSSAAAGWKPAHGPTCFIIFHRSSSVFSRSNVWIMSRLHRIFKGRGEQKEILTLLVPACLLEFKRLKFAFIWVTITCEWVLCFPCLWSYPISSYDHNIGHWLLVLVLVVSTWLPFIPNTFDWFNWFLRPQQHVITKRSLKKLYRDFVESFNH